MDTPIPKARTGPRTPFGPKSLPNESFSLTEFAKMLASATANRLGVSKSSVVEMSLRKVAALLTIDDFRTS